MEMIPITIGKKTLYLNFEKYQSNDVNAIEIYCKSTHGYEPYSTLTTNIEGAELLLNSNECLINTWNNNQSEINDLLDCGYFKDTGKKINISQWCEANIWEIIKKD